MTESPSTQSARPFGDYNPTRLEAGLIRLGRSLPSSKLGRRVASLIRSALSRTRRDPLDLEVLGRRMRLHTTGNACEKRLIVTPHYFDPVELGFVAAAAARAERSGRPFRFVDVGANVGAYSVYAARLGGPATRVLAIDPNSIVLERLRFNLDANAIANVTIANVALGDADGTAEFAVDRHNMGQSSLRLENDARDGKTLIRVPVTTLGGLLAAEAFTHVDVLKIDVEGYEDRVLMPFLGVADDQLLPTAVIIEDSSDVWASDLLGALAARGYRNSELPGSNNLIFERQAG